LCQFFDWFSMVLILMFSSGFEHCAAAGFGQNVVSSSDHLMPSTLSTLCIPAALFGGSISASAKTVIPVLRRAMLSTFGCHRWNCLNSKQRLQERLPDSHKIAGVSMTVCEVTYFGE
jgi:hypothetical protein